MSEIVKLEVSWCVDGQHCQT